jgi:hypothetical protein
VADGSVQEGGQAGGRRLSEGANQIVAVQVKEFVVFHTPILPQLRKVSYSDAIYETASKRRRCAHC